VIELESRRRRLMSRYHAYSPELWMERLDILLKHFRTEFAGIFCAARTGISIAEGNAAIRPVGGLKKAPAPSIHRGVRRDGRVA
jgi:hypothetical protein